MKHWLKKYRRWLLIRECGLWCFYCGCKLTREIDKARSITLDHLVPSSKGGSDRIANLVLCCGPCNRKKGDMTAAEFFKSRYLSQRMVGVKTECDCARVPGEGHAWDCATR